MDSIVIGNGVYKIKREFSGSRKVRDIIKDHVSNSGRDKFALTNERGIDYNKANGSVLSREEQ